MEKGFTVISHRTERETTIPPSNSPLGHLSQGISRGKLSMNVPSSSIRDSRKLETTQASSNGRVMKPVQSVHTMGDHSATRARDLYMPQLAGTSRELCPVKGANL